MNTIQNINEKSKIIENNYNEKDVKRFWSYINKLDEESCWEWLMGKDKNGYGKFTINKTSIRAHRFSYIINIGKIENGMWVLHICDNPSCVNPNHLWLGNNSDNQKDMIKKGRYNHNADKKRGHKGEKNPKAKLSEENILEIRKLYKDKSISINKIANQFNVSGVTIRANAIGEFWKHIDNPCEKIDRRIIKLDYEKADEIRRLYKTGKYFQKVLAEMFDVSQILISLVIRNKIWVRP